MYGRDTFIRLASSVCDTPSSFILSRMRRRNAEPTLSIAFIPFNQPSGAQVEVEGGGGQWERLNPSVRLRLTPHLLKPITQSPSFHQPRHTLQTHFSPPPPTPTGNSFTLYRPSTNSCNINSHHVNTYFLVAATTVFLTFSQVKLLSNISGIGSSSASSKYINPRRGKESSETENFSLYKESI